MVKKNYLKMKSLTSFALFQCFLILAVSGFVLYIRPEGGIATWTGWSFLGLSKQEWEGVHTLFALLVFSFSMIHLYLNWNVLIGYLQSKRSRELRVSKELLASIVLVLLLLVAGINQWYPVGKIMEWRSEMKKGELSSQPPLADFESMSLSEVGDSLNMPPEELLAKMKRLGIDVGDKDQKLLEIAQKNALSPEKIYTALTDDH